MLNSQNSVHLTALDRDPWLRLQADLQDALAARRLEQFAAPTTLILHNLLDSALKSMHLQVFRQIAETDFGLALEGNEEHLLALYDTELSEHGTQNIARFCESGPWRVSVTIDKADASATSRLLQVEVPVPWDRHQCQTERLMEALGFRLDVAASGKGSRMVLSKQAAAQVALDHAELLDMQTSLASVGAICGQLAYGLIHFSAAGEILAVSPSMLARLGLDQREASIQILQAAIPLSFLNDTVWGLALAEGNGAFENYRIRLRRPGSDQVSILFNVSGFRDADGRIQSLWQAVFQDEGGAQLAEGSMLSEVRIHNITRNYVPQLVEQKARDAVRLGKTSLSNEERKLAVMFCDIVGFTSYVESNADSESIIDTLNSILRRISGSVISNRGSIDKFMGDCIMALFDDPVDAVLAAINMQSHSEDINSLRIRAGQQTLQLRIGIHWGDVVVGNVGTAQRLDWTAIGDVVNTASRIEKGCQPGSILVGQAVRDAIESAQPGRFSFAELFELQVKGKLDALSVCHVTLATGP